MYIFRGKLLIVFLRFSKEVVIQTRLITAVVENGRKYSSGVGQGPLRLEDKYFSAWKFLEHVKSHNEGGCLPGLDLSQL
jgi:hypothetical protein